MENHTKRVVNAVCQMEPLLKLLGVDLSQTGSTTFHCPFPRHHGRDNKKSAQFFPDTNQVYCYTEHWTYRPYDVMRILGYSDNEIMRYILPYLGSVIITDSDIELPPLSHNLKKTRKKFIQTGDVSCLRSPVKQYLKKLRNLNEHTR